ncbi:hypothetical protein [Aurantiacibacter xanthus]|nr:hypothetical protein [Aurantiacibacter xanthus]
MDYDPPMISQAPCQLPFGAENRGAAGAATAIRQSFAANRQFFAAP